VFGDKFLVGSPIFCNGGTGYGRIRDGRERLIDGCMHDVPVDPDVVILRRSIKQQTFQTETRGGGSDIETEHAYRESVTAISSLTRDAMIDPVEGRIVLTEPMSLLQNGSGSRWRNGRRDRPITGQRLTGVLWMTSVKPFVVLVRFSVMGWRVPFSDN
jgi:hypothetical protein